VALRPFSFFAVRQFVVLAQSGPPLDWSRWCPGIICIETVPGARAPWGRFFLRWQNWAGSGASGCSAFIIATPQPHPGRVGASASKKHPAALDGVKFREEAAMGEITPAPQDGPCRDSAGRSCEPANKTIALRLTLT